MIFLIIFSCIFAIIWIFLFILLIKTLYDLYQLEPKNYYKKQDKIRKKNDKVWHYTCINGHKWESYSSPTSFTFAINNEMEPTMCPECDSTVCQGSVYINGKYANMGAMHMGFTK